MLKVAILFVALVAMATAEIPHKGNNDKGGYGPPQPYVGGFYPAYFGGYPGAFVGPYHPGNKDAAQVNYPYLAPYYQPYPFFLPYYAGFPFAHGPNRNFYFVGKYDGK